MTDATGTGGPISDVREGMAVLDSAGQEIGTVREIRMSDPHVTTAQGQGRGVGGGLIADIADALTTDTLPQQAQERLARLGYVRVDAHGLFTGDRYAASDEIAGVRDETVHLSVPADRLLG